jgi:hypothetical protein
MNASNPSADKAHRLITLNRRVRSLIAFFIVALALSGLTAIPLVAEIKLLNRLFGNESFIGNLWPALASWISLIHQGLILTAQDNPFLFYGTDWLAFGHIVIAIAFIGPLRDPVRNLWVIELGLVACVLVIPWTLAFGSMRSIPLFWQVVDMSFGVFGFVPLWLTRRYILEMKSVEV